MRHYRKGNLIYSVGDDTYSVAAIGDTEPEGFIGSPDLARADEEVTAEQAGSLLGWPVESVDASPVSTDD